MNRITLLLTMTVTYELHDADIGDLEDNLLAIATRASAEGWITEGTEAEVVVADPRVQRIG